MILFKTLIRRYHELMKCIAQRPDAADGDGAETLLQALEQLATEAERLEVQLRKLSETRQLRQDPPPKLRLVWPPQDDQDKASG